MIGRKGVTQLLHQIHMFVITAKNNLGPVRVHVASLVVYKHGHYGHVNAIFEPIGPIQHLDV